MSTQSVWNDERRWDYTHGVLSLEAVAPLYDYIGIPFRDEAKRPFQEILRAFLRDAYLPSEASAVVSLEAKQTRLLQAIETAFNGDWRDDYTYWLQNIWVYRPGEQAEGWSSWRTIFMRCSVRSGWWSRLKLPATQEAVIRQELEDCKARTDDARDLISEAKGKPASAWNAWIMERLGIDDESKSFGEPFSSVQLTATFFMFYLFWVKLMKTLSPAELDELWESARTIAPDLEIRQDDLPHPNSLQIMRS
jgi:hypothetical protein